MSAWVESLRWVTIGFLVGKLIQMFVAPWVRRRTDRGECE